MLLHVWSALPHLMQVVMENFILVIIMLAILMVLAPYTCLWTMVKSSCSVMYSPENMTKEVAALDRWSSLLISLRKMKFTSDWNDISHILTSTAKM